MFTKYFFKFFPPPVFLQMPFAGVDISDEAIRFIEFKHVKDARELKRYGEKKLPDGAVEAGFINDKLAVITALKDLKKNHGLSFVQASLPEEKAYLFQTDVPTLDDKEIRENIESKLEENVPVSAAEAIFDYTIISNNEKGVHVSVVVLPVKVVEAYLEVFEEAGLTVLSFYSEARAIAQSIIPRNDPRTYLVVNFTEKAAGLFIISGGVVRFTSTVMIGGETVTETLTKTFDVSVEEADKMKKEKGFGADTKAGEELFNNAINTFAALKDEINKVYVYWHTRSDKDTRIERIIMIGKNSMFTGLAGYLSSNLKADVSIGNVWTNVFSFEKTIPPIERSESLNYTVPIGLALADNNNHV